MKFILEMFMQIVPVEFPSLRWSCVGYEMEYVSLRTCRRCRVGLEVRWTQTAGRPFCPL